MCVYVLCYVVCVLCVYVVLCVVLCVCVSVVYVLCVYVCGMCYVCVAICLCFSLCVFWPRPHLGHNCFCNFSKNLIKFLCNEAILQLSNTRVQCCGYKL